ncbi:hypothetical protein BO86DRAFT_438049 [Aspergillus japonicus CBS 114.51]|uniref:Extracellular membrane protein CFEM domain-containing protein n=2 Tax=Aspergillus subgen. Circumdati TaxID=2720871 RepID=A0A2V5IDZ7_9EURO|nr:hypothetical protein BO86DRAFT_438049 [Aspergillus japonicus CBS 114.51]PYI34975.1 hypothetical protein BP00DRAFT_335311 [Aspergillus indologenus CBS 114.80]RAH78656.1 hypothetical protein BO86DRAFT_438049 [Aspergillus japonicus CBS 114.51]
MKPIFALGAFALLVIQARAACYKSDTYCSDWGAKVCECDEGYLMECEEYLVSEVDGEGGESYALWTRLKNCPVPADGGLQCVDGACTS